MLTFFTSESHPIVHPWAWERLRSLALDTSDLGLPPSELGGLGARELIETLGISGIVIQSAISSALVLLMIRRWGESLPFGWLSFMFGVNAASASILHSTSAIEVSGGVSDWIFGGEGDPLQGDR